MAMRVAASLGVHEWSDLVLGRCAGALVGALCKITPREMGDSGGSTFTELYQVHGTGASPEEQPGAG